MQFKTLLAAAASAALVSAQNNSLAAVLNSTSELSVLNSLLQNNTALFNELANATNITILAPSNAALNLLTNTSAFATIQNTPGLLAAALSYHVLNGTYYASDVTSTPKFLHSFLAPTNYTNVTGGQVVEARRRDDTVSFLSAYKIPANVTTADVNITNGVVHIIDGFLLFPDNVSTTAEIAGLTSLDGALNATNLTSAVDTLSDITVFAPVNAAFQAIAGTLSNLSTAEAASILEYHVLNGTVAYSSLLSNTTNLTTLSGQPLNISIVDGAVFVNSARVVIADVLVANGVVHVIDAVLNPNATAAPDAAVTTPVVAFSGASSGTVAPYTSGATATSTAQLTPTNNVASGYTAAPTGALSSQSEAAASGTSSTSSAGAVPTAAVGAMGAMALFGGAVMMVNV